MLLISGKKSWDGKAGKVGDVQIVPVNPVGLEFPTGPYIIDLYVPVDVRISDTSLKSELGLFTWTAMLKPLF